jgi:hypothetical protein
MRVKVRPINTKGRPLFTQERHRGSVFAGELKVIETRLDRFGRGMTTAIVIDTIDNIDKNKMRMRGFEEITGVQYAQAWDVEII